MTSERLDVLRHTAENIDTGLDSPDTSRALVVFNETREARTGTSIYRAETPWLRGVPLPPIAVTDMRGRAISSHTGFVVKSEDRRGRADREHLEFDISFAVTDVPANGWTTYLAWFTDHATSERLDEAFLEPIPGLIVIETTRHGGDLPASGTF